MVAMARMLQKVHACDVPLDVPVAGGSLVHGDYGPQNLLFSASADRVLTILDWEWAHYGEAIEDLASVEWVVRTHHPTQLERLLAFYDAYGERPVWRERQEAMVRRCREFREKDPVDRASVGRVAFWDERIELVGNWRKIPGE
tara:strand:+ start:871 stop:1299 length:429 start_codon:yes stop_codon:yes gene_type:complete